VSVLDRLPSLLSSGASETAVTPGRKSSLLFDFPEPQIQRLPYTLYREGSDLNPCFAADLGISDNVHLLPSGWWALRPYQLLYLFERQEVQPGIIRQSGGGATPVPNVGLFQTAPGWQEHPMWRTPTELFGLSFDPAAVPVGDHFIVKGVTASGDWSTSMPYGPGADTPPPLGGTVVQMQRAAAGDTTHEENTGYSVRYEVPGHLASSSDVIAHMTFGGPTPTVDRRGNALPAGQQGGQHGVTFFGNGDATLWEYVKTGWRGVMQLGHGLANQGRRFFHWLIMPQGHAPFNMFAAGTGRVHANSPVAVTTPHPRPIPIYQAVYHPNPIVTGYQRKDFATGPGQVKFDHRADLRMHFQVSRLVFPPGVLVDHPFFVTAKFSASAPGGQDSIILTVIKDEPAGTSITAEIHDPSLPYPGNVLTQDTSVSGLAANQSAWIPNPNQQAYYVVFKFNPPPNGFTTPFLKGYQVLVNGVRIDFPADSSWTGTTPRSYSITSTDLDPTHESAQLEIADVDISLERLRIRSRVPVQVRTQYDPADASKFSVLFQGETALTHATKRGRQRDAGAGGAGTPVLWPAQGWRNLQVSCVGMASRVADQLALAAFPFSVWDRDAPNVPGATKVTTALDYLLNVLGYPEDMRDVPDLPLRCPAGGAGDASEFLLQPTANVIEFIIHVCRKYLGAYLVFDANAGARGMWRVLFPPEPPYGPLWTFTTAPPPGSGRLAYTLPPPGTDGPYGPKKTFIRRLTTWVQPPEGNKLIVTTTGELYPAHEGKVTHSVVLWNPNSYNEPGLSTADPTGPDYLGRCVPLIYYEPQLAPVAAMLGDNILFTVAKRIYEQACVAQKWIEFDAPLVLMTDPADPNQARPRPLRLYDPIDVEDVEKGVTLSCVVRNATYNWKNDRAQMMTLQCLAPANANSGIVRSI
jgi:hypothetical protein